MGNGIFGNGHCFIGFERFIVTKHYELMTDGRGQEKNSESTLDTRIVKYISMKEAFRLEQRINGKFPVLV